MDPRSSLALWLRGGRTQRGLTLEDVSRVTKIQLRLLELLESGKPDGLPADVFVRGFVRSFARCVGLDEDEALRRYGACGVASAPAVTARAMVEAMAELAPSTVRAMPSRPPLASGSLQDLPKADATGELPAPAVAAAEIAPGASAEIAVAAPVVAAPAAPAVVAPAAPAPAPAVVAAPAPAVVAAPAPAAAIPASADAAPAEAAPAPAKKKRTRRAATAGAGTSTGTTGTTGTGKGRGKRKVLASGTPAEASPVIATDGAPAASEASTKPAASNAAVVANVSANDTATATKDAAVSASEVATAAKDAAVFAANDAPTAAKDAAVAAKDAAVTAKDAAVTAKDAASSNDTGGIGDTAAAWAAVIDAARDAAASSEAIPAAEGAPASAIEAQTATAVDPWDPAPLIEPAPGAFDEPIATATWRPKMPPAATQSGPPWRRPRHAVSAQPAVPSLVIDDADPESAEQVLEDRAAASSVMTAAQRRSFLPPVLLDREDRSARQGGLTLAVIILLIAATLTLSYLMRRPSSSGDGVTERAAPAQSIG